MSPLGQRRSLRLSIASLSVVLLASCGLPSNDDPRPIAESRLPADLRAAADAPEGAHQAEAEDPGHRVYWVNDDEQLVSSPLRASRNGLQARLDELAAGPADQLRAKGLTSALGSTSRLLVESVSGSTVRIDVDMGSPAPIARALPIAIGQIVLTATSARGVNRVILLKDGQSTGMPLPGGALTSLPLSATQYASLRAPAEAPHRTESPPDGRP